MDPIRQTILDHSRSLSADSIAIGRNAAYLQIYLKDDTHLHAYIKVVDEAGETKAWGGKSASYPNRSAQEIVGSAAQLVRDHLDRNDPEAVSRQCIHDWSAVADLFAGG